MVEPEKHRIQTLEKYKIHGKDIHHMFEDVATLAAEGCDKPFSMLSFIEQDTQWIASCVGLFPKKSNGEQGLCLPKVGQTGLIEIADTHKDSYTQRHTWVTHSPHIRSCASMPLFSDDAQLLGCISVFDTQTGKINSQQKTVLRLLAKDVMSRLELRKKNHALMKLQELNELITENNPDPIFAKDSEFKILHANKAFLSLYPEEKRDKVIGYTTLEEYKEEEANAFLAQDRLAFELGKTETTEKILFPTGETRTLFTTKTRFEDDEGKAYILGVSRDVTERENLILKLQKSNTDLDEFAYIASHDLKAPLNAIKRLVSWIEEDAVGTLQGDSAEHFNMIKSRVNRMDMLLKDLLNYSRVGKNDGLPQPLNLKDTVQQCLDLLDVPEHFEIEADTMDLVLPKLPLELVLTNLLSNAIKHHDKTAGKIKVSGTQTPHEYKISVSDNGPGIPKHLHQKIFMKFQTLKPRDELEASGLGLAIVEKALSNYGSQIAVQSDLGLGSIFIITWPKTQGIQT